MFQFFDIHGRLFFCLYFLLAVTTVVGLSETLKVSNSDELRSFLLSLCNDALESTTNSRSSGFITDGAGETPKASGRSNKSSLSFSLSFRDTFGHASLLSLRLFLGSILEFHTIRTPLSKIG